MFFRRLSIAIAKDEVKLVACTDHVREKRVQVECRGKEKGVKEL
jgi:hypothetical protein